MPRISIIIRSYNEGAHIQKLLTGIASQSVKDVEVILVDSGSTDRTVLIAESNGVRIVHIAKEEFSFGRALNRGCAVATGDVLVFASAHVYPLRTDWLEKLVQPFDDADITLAYGRQIGNSVTKFSEHQVFASWFPEVSVRRQNNSFCNNANCAIRRSAWEGQPYDEVLTGLEDLAWAKNMRRRGGQISYVADATIVHVHNETWIRVRSRYQREAIALSQIEPSIRFGFNDFVSLTTANVLHDLVAARRHGKMVDELASVILFRFNQFWGTWKGYRSHGELDAALRSKFYYPKTDVQTKAPLETGKSRVDGRTIQYDHP
ncbi:glycosyltransferase family 2 protein [Pararhizobium sp. LjRoot235]|uniref:glycosyltransferase family 2 protein n=1 Tax=Pararhizobium sp. LjRoot235 TaxID=3342291 RepID=UPI003ECCE96F